MEAISQLLALQAGVVSRRQVTARGLTDADIARRLRRREWASVHQGVYVDHTGELTWLQKAWAAVLFSWPSALSHESAVRAGEGPGRPGADDLSIHVMVARHRNIVAPAKVRIHRRAGFDEHVLWHRSPPRVRYEYAALDVAAAATTDFEAVAVLAKAVQSRRTTARRLQHALDVRKRLPRRAWMNGVLRDVAEGSCSVLELGYLRQVERAHGLPRAQRQQIGAGRVGRVYRDASYGRQLVELDGRLFHDTAEGRDRDFDRDLTALASGKVTARVSYGQVFGRPCWTAGQVGRLLQAQGWTGSPVPCGPACTLLQNLCG